MSVKLGRSVIKKVSLTTTKKASISRPRRGDFFIMRPARLILADGSVFEGSSPNWQTSDYGGEVVFNTGMTGYPETLTDPSYSGQLLTFTYPLIGNYGAQSKATWESDKIQVRGVIVSEAAQGWSHAGSDRSLMAWLKDEGIPIITDIDTRALTRHLREQGTMAGRITTKQSARVKLTVIIPKVTIPKPIIYNDQQAKTVILVDCGVKANIVRSLLALPLRIKRVPAGYDYTKEDYDGVLLSNGPGDPTDYQPTIAIAKKALKLGKPMFGICLGTQLMGLAAGAKTYKLPYGHRGQNQPCLEVGKNYAYITSQNHGYAIDERTLPDDWQVTFRNLNDESVEGIAHSLKPFFAVQFHPEASPGPTDTHWLFKRFMESL